MIAADMDARIDALKAPFPWFGGKSRASSLIWSRLGNVDTYNEPFAGSLAVLLSRPHTPRVETVNDLDCYLANFWRALQADPESVAYYADYPVNETDLHARHQWLVNQAEFQAAMKADPEFFDPKIAGWWVWGQCLWIGSGWCSKPEWTGRGHAAGADRGVHALGVTAQRDRNPNGAAHQARRPHLSSDQGVTATRRWNGGGKGGGSGVCAPGLVASSDGLYDYLAALSDRLRRVRVCCGNWDRILTPSVTTYIGVCGVVLDPPYDPEAIAVGANKVDGHAPSDKIYNHHDPDVSRKVREWAIANGDNPLFRIALCGYEGEHTMPETWECVEWKAHGGYSRTERGKANRGRERVWFSPHCDRIPNLFSEQTA